jgi:hypothetical protein
MGNQFNQFWCATTSMTFRRRCTTNGIRLCCNRIKTSVPRTRLSTLAADYAVPSFLIRSGVSPEIFQNHQLKIEDQIELYTKRLKQQTGEIRLLFILPAQDETSPIELLMVHCLLDEAPPYPTQAGTHLQSVSIMSMVRNAMRNRTKESSLCLSMVSNFLSN